jgi:site-specific DNA-methyltransferase (adenine-specific)
MTFKTEIIAPGVSMIFGDCREVLPTLGKVDHILADPPYEKHMHAHNGIMHRTDGGKSKGPMGFASIDGVRDEVTALMGAACQGWLLVFCTTEGVALWRDSIEASGIRYKRACVWIKPDSAPQFNGQGPALGHENFALAWCASESEFESIVTAWCAKGHSRWNGGGRRGVFTHAVNPPSRHGEHPTEKPIALMCELVTEFTNPGDLVCDPFAGSGTTGIACVKFGRRFVGIEKDQKWFDLACRRIAGAHKQADLFGEPASTTKMKQPLLMELPTKKKSAA